MELFNIKVTHVGQVSGHFWYSGLKKQTSTITVVYLCVFLS